MEARRHLLGVSILTTLAFGLVEACASTSGVHETTGTGASGGHGSTGTGAAGSGGAGGVGGVGGSTSSATTTGSSMMMSDPCSGAPDGAHCGTDLGGLADHNSLYQCSGGRMARFVLGEAEGFVSGDIANFGPEMIMQNWERVDSLEPYAVLDGPTASMAHHMELSLKAEKEASKA